MELIMIGLSIGIICLLIFVIVKISGLNQTKQQMDEGFKTMDEGFKAIELSLVERLLTLQNDQYKTLTEVKEQLKKDMNQDFMQLNEKTETHLISIQEKLHLGLTTVSRYIQSDLEKMSEKMTLDFNRLNTLTEKRLLEIDDKVNQRLDKGFEKTNEAFQHMIVRLAKIDEAQKNIANLSQDIVSLQNVLGDKKSRGTFGEVQLSNILDAVFGQNKKLYELQHKMPDGSIVDALLKAPEPLGNVSIDSKFPLENYTRMSDRTLDETIRAAATKQFVIDVKKHIDAIATKYIVAGYTSNQAMMFVPAEAVFAEINAYHQGIVEYSQKKRVWLVSPTTLMSTLTTIEVIVQNLEQAKYAKEIQVQLEKLGSEFNRYKSRWDKLSNQVGTVYKSTQEIHTTTEKIGKRFEDISKVKFDEAIETEE